MLKKRTFIQPLKNSFLLRDFYPPFFNLENQTYDPSGYEGVPDNISLVILGLYLFSLV